MLERTPLVTGLMNFQGTIQGVVLKTFQSPGKNELKLAALVPLIKDSYAIYGLVTKILRSTYASGFFDISTLVLLADYSIRHPNLPTVHLGTL